MTQQTYRQFDAWRSAPVRENSRRQIVSSYYFDVEYASYHSPTSGHFERYFVRQNRGDTVGVIAFTDDRRIPLVEQYRLPTHRWTLEIPAGHATSPAERQPDVAARKLREEAGFTASKFTLFLRFINTPSFSTQHTSLFLATGLSPVGRSAIGPETPRAGLRLYTIEEAYRMVLNGTIIDAKTIIAILRAHSDLLTNFAANR